MFIPVPANEASFSQTWRRGLASDGRKSEKSASNAGLAEYFARREWVRVESWAI